MNMHEFIFGMMAGIVVGMAVMILIQYFDDGDDE